MGNNPGVPCVRRAVCFNGQDGIDIAPSSPVIATGDTIDQNGRFAIDSHSSRTVPATGIDWGLATTNEMVSKPLPSNLSSIFDHFDDPRSGFVDYSGFVTPGIGCGGT
jgi:hypothetical protein